MLSLHFPKLEMLEVLVLVLLVTQTTSYVSRSMLKHRRFVGGQTEAFASVETAQEVFPVSIMTGAGSSSTSSSAAGGDGYSELEKLSGDFTTAWLKALQGKLGPMKDVFPDGKAIWSSPVSKTLDNMKEQFINFSDFFPDPALTVYDRRIDAKNNEIELDYQLSFWYPLPWRPRIIVPGKAILKTNAEGNRVLSVQEEWEVSITNILTKQAAPRLWDIWHIFSTPTPEYAPTKTFGRVNRKVTLVELPPSISVENSWIGPAKFPGPPLLVLPGFALDGELRTSRPNRDPFLATLPVESSGDSFTAADGTPMKRNSFTMHVPSQLHMQVVDEVHKEDITVMKTKEQLLLDSASEEFEGEDDEAYESDAQVGISDNKLSNLENISIMKSVTGGIQRGQYGLNENLVKEFTRSETLTRRYKALPRRMMAQVTVNGEVTPEKVKEAVEMIKNAVSSPSALSMLPALPNGKKYALKQRSDGSNNPLVGFQMFGIKACFNMAGRPAMAIYEIQYDQRITKVQVELQVV